MHFLTPQTRNALLLAGFCCLIWLPGLPARTLWPTDEARYAVIAGRMASGGDYVVPIKRGAIYHSQPPLFLWSGALALTAAGEPSETALRVPSFLAGLAGVLIVNGLAGAWFGAGAGLLSGLVLATDIRYLIQAQWISTDMLLCLWITAALACFAQGYRRRQPRWYLACHALVGAAVLTKGPVGMVIPGLVILVFLAAERNLREIARLRLPSGALIIVAVLMPWSLLYWFRAGRDHAMDLVLTQSLQRYTAAWNNQQPFHYFLRQLPLDLLPWSAAVPFALWFSRGKMPSMPRRLLASWLGVVFVFFSISSAKRGVYLLPLHPAAAMCVGWYWHAARGEPAESPLARSARWCARVTAAIFLLAGVAGAAWAIARASGADMRQAAWALATLACLAGLAVAIAPVRLAPHAVALSTGMLALAALALAAPLQNRRLDPVPFAREVSARVPPGASLAMVRRRFEELAWYGGLAPERELRAGPDVEAWLARPETVYAVVNGDIFERLPSTPPPAWREVSRGTVAGEPFHLIVNEPRITGESQQ